MLESRYWSEGWGVHIVSSGVLVPDFFVDNIPSAVFEVGIGGLVSSGLLVPDS